MVDRYRDAISGIIMFLFSSAYLAGSFRIREYGDAAVNSRFFPQLLGGMLLILSVVQLVLWFLRRNRAAVQAGEPAQDGDAPSRVNRSVFFTLAAILGYILLLDLLGFLLSSTLFLVVQTMLMAPAGKRRPVLTLGVSCGFSLLVYGIFVYGFSLALPEGIFR